MSNVDLKKLMYEANGPWRNDACQGYVLKVLNVLDVDKQTKKDILDQLYVVFDDMTTEEAIKYWQNNF